MGFQSLREAYAKFGHFTFIGNVGKPECFAVTKSGAWVRAYGVTLETPPDLEDVNSNSEYLELWDAWEKAKEEFHKFHSKHSGGYKHTSNEYSYTYNYTPTTMLDGVDRKKWPSTWKFLLKFINAKDFSKNTKYVYKR